MKKIFPELVEQGRITQGPFASQPKKPYGFFYIAMPDNTNIFKVIASNGCRESSWWEHVSVSLLPNDKNKVLPDRTPNWEEMCFIKNLFWDEDECVVQFHPAKKDYVNHHPFVLHLWKPLRHKDKLATPPSHLVGPK